jgi:hypothetical protein
VTIQLRDVVKSVVVEDPVNRYVHRPLQLLLVRVLIWTPLTPNQVTLLSLVSGLGAAACIVVGSRSALLLAGVLLFGSAILDGVDGMLARLKKSSSEIGHALDGAADYLVNLTTCGAAAWHVGAQTGHPLLAALLAGAAHVAWAHHMMLYDFQCATYLRFEKGGTHAGGDIGRAAELLHGAPNLGMSRLRRLLMRAYVWQLGNRQRLVGRIDPAALECAALPARGEHAVRYVETQRSAMKLWALCGNALHVDLMALAAATDQLGPYLLARAFGFSAFALLLSFNGRRLSRRFLASVARPAEVQAA